MADDLITTPEALEPEGLPPEFLDRKSETVALIDAFSEKGCLQNLHLHGPHGVGKTHLINAVLQDQSINHIYANCSHLDTQYKMLQQLCTRLSGEEPGDGYHTSELQRRIKNHVGQVPTVIVLDEIEFLLLNDGDDLLYALSRMNTDGNLGLVTISANQAELSSELEQRTFSSLHPETLSLEPYSQEQTYEILADRARRALKSQSIHRQGLTEIASTTQNIAIGLVWLKSAAETADTTITEQTVTQVQQQAYRRYADDQLRSFSEHHRLLYQAIRELAIERESTTNTGTIHGRYEKLCDAYSEDSLSQRRISDLLKHLELLDLVEAEYHYGGSKGKTREIQLKRPSAMYDT